MPNSTTAFLLHDSFTSVTKTPGRAEMDRPTTLHVTIQEAHAFANHFPKRNGRCTYRVEGIWGWMKAETGGDVFAC